jgi:DNA-directed RNA polymerase specialized sigma24 family protein
MPLALARVMENLTEKVLHYQRTRQGLDDIVNAIAPRVYHFPRRTMGWDEDACGEFYVFIHPRIIRLVDRFRNQGKPFESYLWAVLNWQLRNFARGRNREERRWRVSLRMEPGAPVSIDEPPALPDQGVDALVASSVLARYIRSDADRRNFLFFVLKCSRLVDTGNAPALARAAGVTVPALLGLIATLRDMRSAREDRCEMFRGRRNRSFAAVSLLEHDLRDQTDPARRAAAEQAVARMRRRMASAMQRMSRVALAPTNLEISRVLGVPKGTVDSGLYWLKRKLSPVYDPDNLRSA